MQTDPRAGQPADASMLVDIPRLMTNYYTRRPDASVSEQRVAFGTSGHRGTAFDCTFDEDHILAITQAIRDYRRSQQIDGPLFLDIDTPVLTASLDQRFASRREGEFANKLLSAMRFEFGAHEEKPGGEMGVPRNRE